MNTTTFSRNSETFWDRIAPKYARQPIKDMNSYQQKIAKIKQLLKPADRLLEIGCGTGGTALQLAPNVSELVATDISRKMVEIANSKLESQSLRNVKFLQAEADEQVSVQSFDVICAFSLLHLVNDIPQVLKRVLENLEPGGLFISKTVCLKEGSLLIRAMVRVLTAVGIAPRVTAISRNDLIGFVKDAGFEIEEVSHFGSQKNNPFIVARRPSV